MMRTPVYLFLALALASPAAAVEARNPVEIKEWVVPYESSRPRDPFARRADEVWFVGQRGHYLARLDPTNGEFSRRRLEDRPGPHNLIVGSDGIVWYAGNRKGYIGRYDPQSGRIERIAMPDPRARDPHTLVFDSAERHIWFTLQASNRVGRLRLADRSVELIAVESPHARPYGIIVAADGVAWIALFGTNRLASVDPRTLEIAEHALPNPGARPRRLGAGGDGSIFYTDYARGTLGRLDPATGKVEEWAMPSGGNAQPYAMAVDAIGRVWFVETGPSPNNLVGFDPRRREFFSVTPIPSGAGSVRHMDYHAPTRTIWFGTDSNTIGRARLGE